MQRLFLVFFLFFLFTNYLAADVRFCAVGDIMLDRGVKTRILRNNTNHPFEKVSFFINEFDLAFCNLECPLTDKGVPLNKKYCFEASPNYINALKKSGFNILSIANNHTIDMGRDAFLETKKTIEDKGLYAVGGGKNQEEARKPIILEINGLKFAFFGYIDMLLEALVYLENKPYPAWANSDEIIKQIRAVRKEVDFIVVSFHWGVEFQQIPTINQVKFAHELIDAGADLILGHHPHVLQPIEIYKDKYIVYSLGNFVFDQHKLFQRQSMVFCCNFTKEGIDSVYIKPILIEDFRPTIAENENYDAIIEKMQILAEEYNAEYITIEKKTLVVEKENLLNAYVSDNMAVIIYRNKIELIDSNLNVVDYFDIQYPNELKECCIFEENEEIRIYGIIGNADKLLGGSIVIFPIYGNKISMPLKDVHDFNPWKIKLADVDGDANPDLCVGVWKKTRYYDEYDNRLFIYNRTENYIYPKWLGSKFANPFIDYEFSDIDNDSRDELILLEKCNDGNKRIVAYRWNTFGFKEGRTLKDNYEETKLEKYFSARRQNEK
ncbi:CapA family protein [bacterium]